jgi:hypothetical protein
MSMRSCYSTNSCARSPSALSVTVVSPRWRHTGQVARKVAHLQGHRLWPRERGAVALLITPSYACEMACFWLRVHTRVPSVISTLTRYMA